MKPQMQETYVNSVGQPFRDDGKGSLVPEFGRLPVLTNPSQVTASGVPVGGLYVLSATSTSASGIVYRRNA